MPKVKDLLSEQIERGNVVLHGWLGSAEVIDLLRKSDVFTLVSAYEGFCIALVEAMANGCCPVVTDIRSGNKQLVTDGENGFVVPVGDVEAFVEKIVYLAETPEKLLEFRQKAWRTGKQYSVERMVEAYEKCFERAVHDARATPRRPQPDFPLMESCRSKYPLWLRRIKAKAKSFV
jgi:glycosyltransferase involved in cell wall biosynthesis